MIKSRNEIVALLQEYMITFQEYSCSWYSEVKGWNGKRQANYINGVVLGKLQEHDSNVELLMKQGVSEDALYNEIITYLTYHIDSIMENKQYDDILSEKSIELHKKQKEEIHSCLLDDWIEKHCEWIDEYMPNGSSYSGKKAMLFLYYSFENFKYEKEHKYCDDLDELKKEYNDTLGKHNQFKKYGIIPVDDCRELICNNPPCVYDNKINKTFFIKNIPLRLLDIIDEMMDDGIIGNLSVRLMNKRGYPGRLFCSYIAEAVERGPIFEFDNLGSFSVSKLYSEKYEDCLWIVTEPNDITFEELCEDFEIYDDMIVTQVVHLQYEKDEDIFITHLDHEYVFYTVDEYRAKNKNVKQKGTARTRMKSFKIDNSRIPFNHRCKIIKKDENGNELCQEDEQFLCYVLECYFKHKDLLKEYFQHLL